MFTISDSLKAALEVEATTARYTFAKHLESVGLLKCSSDEAMSSLAREDICVSKKNVTFSDENAATKEKTVEKKEKKTVEKKTVEKKTVEKKTVEKKTVEKKTVEKKTVEKKKPVASKCPKKPRVQLPFCGEVVPEWCEGMRFTGGLHTQCTSRKPTSGSYCSACKGSAAKGSTGKPNYGNINDRTTDVDYVSAVNGDTVTRYANFAKAKGIDLDEAVVVAAEFGWKISETQLTIDPLDKSGGKAKVKKTSKKKVDLVEEQVSEAAKELFGGEEKKTIGEEMEEKRVIDSKAALLTDLGFDDSDAEDAVTEDAVTEDAVTEVAVTEVAVTEVAVTEDAVTEVAVTEDAVTEGKAMTQAEGEVRMLTELDQMGTNDDLEEEDEDVLELDEGMKVTIKEVDYYKTAAFGFEAVLFTFPDGDVVGSYHEETGDIVDIDNEE